MGLKGFLHNISKTTIMSNTENDFTVGVTTTCGVLVEDRSVREAGAIALECPLHKHTQTHSYSQSYSDRRLEMHMEIKVIFPSSFHIWYYDYYFCNKNRLFNPSAYTYFSQEKSTGINLIRVDWQVPLSSQLSVWGCELDSQRSHSTAAHWNSTVSTTRVQCRLGMWKPRLPVQADSTQAEEQVGGLPAIWHNAIVCCS